LYSGIQETKYELLIVGASLDLGGSAFGILYEHGIKGDFFNTRAIFTEDKGDFGFLPFESNWECRITGEYGKIYLFEGDRRYQELELIWNECGSKLQWNKE
jgi:hypothetical protein